MFKILKDLSWTLAQLRREARRRGELKRLAAMPPRMRDDLGIRLGDIRCELERPFADLSRR